LLSQTLVPMLDPVFAPNERLKETAIRNWRILAALQRGVAIFAETVPRPSCNRFSYSVRLAIAF
jgi:hypothetical protein